MGGINPTWLHFPKPNWSQHKSTYRCDIAITITLSKGKPLVRIDSPLVLLLLPSTGLKWMVGMGHTSCMGLASTRELLFLSHPAPSRNNPRIHTPSCGVAGFDKHSRCSKITMVTNDLKGFTMSHKHQLPAHTLKGILISRLEDCLTMRLAYCNQWPATSCTTYFGLFRDVAVIQCRHMKIPRQWINRYLCMCNRLNVSNTQ